ncbi:3-deoxy-D-manno-octulosonic acid transferase [Stieleria varia]|uniref:3-deoxy-D-manno-octulosonic acid transferase n=1 Tax=Stieleria varia TaxID=2528005 RepID=A0A5C6B6U0_9BACT|nr:3-deoxy-D-manno-octulosonic acid transferase [Stieleria varia]TWU07678.1 3-deoxy-D-manno-octulosonic acid transferase [Stieleria varia]
MIANALYFLALFAASPWIAFRMFRHGRYRRGIGQKFWGLSRDHAAELRGDHADCIWLHAVSVGEVNLLGGFIKAFSERFPEQRIVVSTSTDTGYDLAVAKFGAGNVFFCPLDFTWAVRRTIRHLRPKMLCLAELELWPNLIRIASQNACPVSVINGRLSERSAAGYGRFARLTQGTFGRLNWVGCQDAATKERFAGCGTPKERLQITGSLKFDDAPSTRDTDEVQARVQWAGIDPWQVVWMVGSTQEGEERMALEIYRQLQDQFRELRLILVPRHPERFDDVAELVRCSGLKVHRRSSAGSLIDAEWTNDRVILLDTIGELRHWWGVCQIATVGGSFGNRGGQNMLEPAGYGCAVSFGPNTKNFADIAQRLIDADAAVRVNDQAELNAFVVRCLTNVPAADALGRAAQEVVEQHRGATARTIDALASFVSDEQWKQPRLYRPAA